MTINIISSSEQHGRKYALMANLLLPSIWGNSDVFSLQIGLSKALSRHYKISLDNVFISTSIVNSGMVVASGKVAEW